jgi:hypothetical protein
MLRMDRLFSTLIGPIACAFVIAAAQPALAQRTGQLKIVVVEEGTGKPLAARMHLKNKAGRMPRVTKAFVGADYFVFDSEINLKLPLGNYSFELECGPEYLDQQGRFEIADFADDEKTIEMKRFVDMEKEGWYSGDLDVEQPAKEIELLMRADDLHVAHLFPPRGKNAKTKADALPDKITLFDGDRCYRPGNGEPIWRDEQKNVAWDLPIKMALKEIDSIELASAQLFRNGMSADEAGGRPRDKSLFPGNDGLARWGEKVYFHLLNCGLRIPPSAGSGSGVSPNPVGYNRVYVHLDDEFSYDAWLEGLRAGRAIVTNGPMIRVNVEGEWPGHIFQADAGAEVELETAMNLATREKISYLEIVQNGKVAHQVRLDEFAKAGGKLPKVRFKESGWFLLRAVADNPKTYRFAMTAPYYVDIGYQPRISKTSVQFFLDWIKARIEMGYNTDPDSVRNQKAIDYWNAMLEKANAD